MVGRILVFIILALTWIILSGKFDAFHLGLGAISCAFVTWISGDLIFPPGTRLNLKRWVAQVWHFALYIPWLLWEIFLANLEVLKLAVIPGGLRKVKPRIVAYRTRLKSEIGRIVFANSITLTPGTITIMMVGDRLFIHAINETMAKGLGGTMENKIARIFEED